MILNKKDIPEKSGIYLFKSKKKILYIGKAKNLKKRIEQYFNRQNNTIICNLLSKSEDIEYIITDDEKDALHLEYNLIHQYQPPFNIRLKDDKTFPYIKISVQEKFPGIYYSRDVNNKNFLIGPISDARKTKDLIDTITRIFKIRTCTTNIFKRSSICLYYYIERCSAPCVNRISEKDYNRNVKDAILFLKGKRKRILNKLRKKMTQFAEELRFEEAQKIKGDIELINQFSLESYISSGLKTDYDVIVHFNDKNDSFIILFSVIQGKTKKRDYFSFNTIKLKREDILKDFLLSFYRNENIPDEIIVQFLPSDKKYIEDVFSNLRGRKTRIKIPCKGNKKRLLNLGIKNLNVYVNKNKFDCIGKKLQNKLQLSNFPDTIEGFDISHLSERERVGAVVSFLKGKANKKMYRNYLIKKALPGDTEALKEILERRFKHNENHPDLIIIDGGKAQLNTTKIIKKKLNLRSDIVSIAKKEERIYLEHGDSVIFPKDSPERFLFQNIRDEVHRRAITHHRKKREKI